MRIIIVRAAAVAVAVSNRRVVVAVVLAPTVAVDADVGAVDVVASAHLRTRRP